MLYVSHNDEENGGHVHCSSKVWNESDYEMAKKLPGGQMMLHSTSKMFDCFVHLLGWWPIKKSSDNSCV